MASLPSASLMASSNGRTMSQLTVQQQQQRPQCQAGVGDAWRRAQSHVSSLRLRMFDSCHSFIAALPCFIAALPCFIASLGPSLPGGTFDRKYIF